MAIARHAHPLCSSLFDRWQDDAPGERRDATPVATISAARWRQAVQRDLHALFNTTCPTRRGAPGARAAMGARHRLAPSVIDYGLPPLAGSPRPACDPDALARALESAIHHFEPRLLRNSLRVTPERATPGHPPHLLRYRIDAVLRARPAPLVLVLRTEIDIDNGRATLAEVC